MHQIRLLHWDPAQARERAKTLEQAGYRVNYQQLGDQRGFRELREAPPCAVVIDLSRTPSHGRDVGLMLRQFKSTRHVPLVFVGGEKEKIEQIRKVLADAVFTPWSRIRSSLRHAIAHPPANPSVPRSIMDPYSETPLVKKLGLKPDSVVFLINAPRGFERTVGNLPRGAKLQRRSTGTRDLSIWFTTSEKQLTRGIRSMVKQIGDGGLWIVWPKKTSGVPSDLTQTIVRKIGLAAGLVDFKVCAVDTTWSGLRFVRRKHR